MILAEMKLSLGRVCELEEDGPGKKQGRDRELQESDHWAV